MNKILFFVILIILLINSCNKIIKTNNNHLNKEIINNNLLTNDYYNEEKLFINDDNQNINKILEYYGIFGELKYIDIMEIINEYNIYNNNVEINWENVDVYFKLFYEGSTIPAADMLFLTNSIMILISKFYSENLEYFENRFYKYSLNNNELELNAIDKRSNKTRWLEVEKWHLENGSMGNIVSIDEINYIVVYNYRNGIYYGGFGFFD